MSTNATPTTTTDPIGTANGKAMATANGKAQTTSPTAPPTNPTPMVPPANPPAPTTPPATPPADPKSNPAPKGKPGKGGGKGGGKGKPAKEPKGAAELADSIAASQAKKEDTRTTELLRLGWKPEPAVPTVLKTVSFDKRLQMRATGPETYNEGKAAEYAELMKEGTVFPPIKLIRITDADKEANALPSNLICWDGFHTGEAAELNKLKEYPAEIMDGTFRLARVLALGANRSHGFTRSEKDKRKAFYQLVDNADLMADAVEYAKNRKDHDGTGGLIRALADIVGISKGSVTNYLNDRNMKVKDGKLVQGRTPKAEAAAAGTTPAADGQPAAGYQPATGTEAVAPVSPLANEPAVNLFTQMETSIAGLERRLESLMTRPGARELIMETAQLAHHPITDDGKGGNVKWAILNTIGVAIESARMAFVNAQANAGKPAGEKLPDSVKPAAVLAAEQAATAATAPTVK